MISGLQYFSFTELWSPLFLALMLLLTAGYFVLIGPLASRFEGSTAVPFWRRGLFLCGILALYLAQGDRSVCWDISYFPSIWSVWPYPIWWRFR